jgi:hypothetical protein
MRALGGPTNWHALALGDRVRATGVHDNSRRPYSCLKYGGIPPTNSTRSAALPGSGRLSKPRREVTAMNARQAEKRPARRLRSYTDRRQVAASTERSAAKLHASCVPTQSGRTITLFLVAARSASRSPMADGRSFSRAVCFRFASCLRSPERSSRRPLPLRCWATGCDRR